WISSDTTVADVSDGGGGGFGGPGGGGRGTVTALKAGTATITATYMSMMASTTVTVTGATVQSIQVSPVNPMITKGGTVQLQAVAIYSDNTSRNVTGMATWTSSNSAIADVSDGFGSKGQVTGIAAGSADITAAFSGVSGKTTVT